MRQCKMTMWSMWYDCLNKAKMNTFIPANTLKICFRIAVETKVIMLTG